MTKVLSNLQFLEAIEVVKSHGGNFHTASASLGLKNTTLRERFRKAQSLNIDGDCVLSKIKASAKIKAAAKLFAESSSHIYADAFKKKLFVRTEIDFSAQKFVITSAQNATPVSPNFFAALQRYCERNNAQLIVIPYRYKNPTSIWSKEQETEDFWAEEITPFLCDQRRTLTQELVLLGDIKTQPTASRPLSGFQTLTGGKSAIIGHPKLELETVPTPQNKLPKILTTTGACTLPNYGEGKAGKIGRHHHTLGAAVVEIDASGSFHLRQINATNDGSFFDLTTHYFADGIKENIHVAGLVMGDSHLEVIDENVVEATFDGVSSIIHSLRPEYLIWHDVIDQYARNHHHAKDPFIAYAKHKSENGVKNNVEKDLMNAFAFIDAKSPAFCNNVFVPSNHVDALGKWIRECDPKLDPENCVFWAKTYVKMLEGTKMTPTGASTPDPFIILAKENLKCAARSIFPKRDESFSLKNIELGFHGDRGPNGARGSRNGFGRIGVKTIIGHSHSPGIRDGVYQVGTSSRYDLEYASGPSSWLHSHCVIYPNGKRSLINIIKKAWRAV